MPTPLTKFFFKKIFFQKKIKSYFFWQIQCISAMYKFKHSKKNFSLEMIKNHILVKKSIFWSKNRFLTENFKKIYFLVKKFIFWSKNRFLTENFKKIDCLEKNLIFWSKNLFFDRKFQKNRFFGQKIDFWSKNWFFDRK